MERQSHRQVSRKLHDPEWLTIGQVAHLTGINAKAIRYYESIGVLPPPQREENGYRCYRPIDVKRLILLRRLRLLGAPLDMLRPLLIEATDARCMDVQQGVLRLIEERLRVIDQEIAELHHLRDQVEQYHSQLAACHPDPYESFDECRDVSCLAFQCETANTRGGNQCCI